ncbi:MAG: MFS transporter [Solirubrobacterales bacterium]
MRRLLFLACAVVFLDVTFFAVLTPLLPDYRSDHSLTEVGAGVLSGSFAAGTLVMALPAGWYAARFGSRMAVLTGLVGIGIFSPVFGFANEIWLLDASRFFQGASGALMWAGAISWVIQAGPKDQRGALVGTVIAAAVVGELLGAPLGALAHQVGTGIVFGSVLILAALLFALAWSIPYAKVFEPQTIKGAISVARGSKLTPAIWLLAAPSFAFGMTVLVAPLKMDDLGASPFLIAAAFAVGSVTEAIVGPVIGKVSDRVGRTGPYLLGVIVVAVAVAAIGAFSTLPAVFVSVVFIAFGSGIAFTPASTLVADVAANAGLNQGYASGAANVAWGGGQMLGAFGGGLLASAGGFLLPALLTVLVLGIAASVARRLVEDLPEEPVSAEGI